jgi:hypothetical protein
MHPIPHLQNEQPNVTVAPSATPSPTSPFCSYNPSHTHTQGFSSPSSQSSNHRPAHTAEGRHLGSKRDTAAAGRESGGRSTWGLVRARAAWVSHGQAADATWISPPPDLGLSRGGRQHKGVDGYMLGGFRRGDTWRQGYFHLSSVGPFFF